MSCRSSAQFPGSRVQAPRNLQTLEKDALNFRRCDLASLWQEQGQNKKALELLQSAYEQFSEGYHTADLWLVRSLMRSLRPGNKPQGSHRAVESCSSSLSQ
jgi:hypothetical protein